MKKIEMNNVNVLLKHGGDKKINVHFAPLHDVNLVGKKQAEN
jgi:hypothetical protein